MRGQKPGESITEASRRVVNFMNTKTGKVESVFATPNECGFVIAGRRVLPERAREFYRLSASLNREVTYRPVSIRGELPVIRLEGAR